MTGKIELVVRQGGSKDKRYKFYPAWMWRVTGENGEVAEIQPTWNQIEKAIRETLIHEKRVDEARRRNPDHTRYRKFLQNLVKFDTQLKIEHFTPPPIYYEFQDIGYKEVIPEPQLHRAIQSLLKTDPSFGTPTKQEEPVK